MRADGSLVLGAPAACLGAGFATDVLVSVSDGVVARIETGIPAHLLPAEALRFDGVLLPGLVNAHTHLLHSRWLPVNGTGFAALTTMSGHRDALAADDRAARVAMLSRLAGAAGITTVAGAVNPEDVALVAAPPPAAGAPRLFVWLTVKDRHPDSAVATAARRLRDLTAVGRISGWGVLVHSLYALGPAGMRRAVATAREHRVPVSIHLAEFREEADWAYGGRTDHRLGTELRRHGQPAGFAGCLQRYGMVGADVVAVHGCHLTAADADALAGLGVWLVACPRTNLTLSGGVAPWPAATTFAVATDGLATAGRLDLFEEADLAGRLRGVPPELGWLTTAPAAALGHRGGGTITVGGPADFAVVRRPDPAAWPTTPQALLSATRAGDVVATVVAGVPLATRPVAKPVAAGTATTSRLD